MDTSKLWGGLINGAGLLLAAGLTMSGCGKKEEVGSTPRSAAEASAPRSPLQSALDELSRIPHEHDPKKRPVVLSEPNSSRRDWALQLLQKGYHESGHTNPVWSGAVNDAIQAYADYSRIRATADRFDRMSNAVMRAIAAGCDDPLIQYMRVRYGFTNTNSKEEYALAQLASFRQMYASQYHPLFKFFAGYRAAEAARDAEVKGKRGTLLELVTGCLEDTVHDTNAPAAEVFDAVYMWVDYSKNKKWLDAIMPDIDPNLQKTWGHEEAFFRLRGQNEITRAWESRGGGFANTVSDTGWEGFRQHLEAAEGYLTKAWDLNSSNAYTAYLMMRVELGQGQGRERMERWFKRAMALAPDYYDAVNLMSFYLEPRWYGTEEDTLEFARGCVASTNWAGRVPLVLPDVHHSLARFAKLAESPDYWRRPGVWEDVRAGYEKFFKLNPNWYGWRHDYAKDAYLCGHYDVFLEQTKKFAGGTNYTFFGGKQKYEEMLARASAAK